MQQGLLPPTPNLMAPLTCINDEHKHRSIKHWPSQERPREKCLKQGVHALSNAELLAIFIQNGVKGKNAIEVARDALHHFGNLKALLTADVNSFTQFAGLGKARYVQMQAALELSRRFLETELEHLGSITSTQAASQFLRSKLTGRSQEVFACLFLDTHHRILKYEELFFGGIHQATIHPREIIQRALSQRAAAIIFAHNHPSGDTTPSTSDRHMTQELKPMLELLEIRLLDHLIIGDCDIFSFAQHGLI